LIPSLLAEICVLPQSLQADVRLLLRLGHSCFLVHSL